MAKTSKGMILNSQSQLQSDLQFVLIDIDDTNSTKLIESVDQNLVFIDAVSKQTNWVKSSLDQLSLAPGCYLISDLRDQTDINVTNLINGFSPIRQYGYQVGIIADINQLPNLDDLIKNQVYLINSGNSNQNQNALLQNNEIDDYSGNLSKGMSVGWQRDYTNVDVSNDHVGYVGMGQDTLLEGGRGFGYSTNGKDFNTVISPKGIVFRRPDAERMWRLLRPKEIEDINNTVGDKVKQEIDSATAKIPNIESTANEAVKRADSAIAASKVNSDAQVAINSAISETKSTADSAMSRAKSAWDVANGAKSAVTDFDPLLKSAQSDADKALTQIADTASALSDAKTAFGSDVAAAKNLASAAQSTADNAVKSASSVAGDLTAVASQAKANADGITKVTSDVGLLQTTVADNSGNISKVQETATQIQHAVSDNAGNITTAKQTADSAATVASDAHSNATAAIQTASQASITANSASGQAASAVLTANGAMTTASNAKSDAAVAIQTASGASLTATNADSDATVAKQTASEATVQASNAESDVSQLSIRANKIEANVTNNSSAIASVQQTANGINTIINDPKTGLNVTYQTAAGNATTISNVKSDVTQLQTTANGLTSRVGSLESKTDTQQTAIEQNKKAIALKADQTTVSTLEGTVRQNTSTLTTQADEIKSKVTSSDVTGMLTGYATQEYAQTLITQKAGQWNLDLTSLKTDVNAIKTAGGGVNLSNGTSSKDQSSGDASQTTGWVTPTIATFDNPQAGQQYTISVNTKSNGKPFKLQIWDGTSPTQKANEVYGSGFILTQGKKSVATITWPSGSNKYMIVQLINNNDGGQITWNSAMLEEGTVAHTWSPAPSDMATVTSVTNLSASVDGIKATVAGKADQSTVTQLSNLVQSKVSTSDFTSKVSQLSNDINARVTKGDLLSQINLEAGNTLIQSGKIYLDANTIVFGKNSNAIIPSAAIGNLDAGKITTGSISVPMSDTKGKATVKVEDGKVIITGIGPGVDQVHSSLTPFDPDYIGQSDITIDHEGLSFDATVDIWNGHPGTNKALGVFRPTSLDTADTAGLSYIVRNFPSNDGPQNAGDFFAIDRQGLGEYEYIHGMVYKASESRGKVHLGFHFYDPVYIHPYGAETGIRSTWCSWSSIGNRKFPVLVNSDNGWSGIAFPIQGPSFIFSNNGYVARPSQRIGNYNGYGNGNKDWNDPTAPNQAGQTIDYSKWA